MSQETRAVRTVLIGLVINTVLAIVKTLAGVIGNSYALVADGVESTLDVFSSLVVWGGLRIATAPPDRDHPYGHGKAEPLATVVVSLLLMGGAIGIAIESVREILTPHHVPAPFTLAVLVGVVLIKGVLSRTVLKAAAEANSTAVKADAWHHLSDAITSGCAFVGISIALIGGPQYAPADDWAALIASTIIFFNGCTILRGALREITDAAPGAELEKGIRDLAGAVTGVRAIDACRVRKSGLTYFVDIHVVVDGALSVTEGHEIARVVRRTLSGSTLRVSDALVHIEPWESKHARLGS